MNVSQSKFTESQGQIGDESMLELAAQIKGLSDEIINSHEDKDTKNPITSNKPLSDFFWILKEGKKIENESGTGYLCDDDDGRDEEFQNG